MGKKGYYQYYVEGADEEKIISVLKTDMGLIIPGKVQRVNVAQEVLTNLRLMQLKKDTTIILIFDTDAGNISILNKNIEILKHCYLVKKVICIPQVNNLEDELLRSCDIRQIKELTNSKSNRDYKHDLIMEKNLKEKLLQSQFDLKKFWSENPGNQYSSIKNGAEEIKI